MEVILFKGNEYPIITINFPDGKKKISSLKLNESLIDKNGGYISVEARFIDEEIFYFVKEEVLYLRENEIIIIILSEIW